jgi:nickel transport system permease protein
MGWFLVRRLAALLPLLLIVSIAVFAVLRFGRGDPAQDYLRLSQVRPTEAALADARRELGLDRPVVEQYTAWLGRAARLDFGRSYVTREPVLEEILGHLPATLELAAAGLAVTLLVSLPLGIWAALGKDRLPDHVSRAIAFTAVSVPNFWLGFLLILLFSVTLGWLPAVGRGGIEHLVMPTLAVSLMSIGVSARLIRSSMLDQLHQRHVFYARARGVAEARVIGRHVFLNALVPIVTALGLHLGELVGGALVVEVVFGWPGVGRLAVSAVYNRDYPMLQCFILLMTAVFLLVNLGVDLVQAWLDPRIRAGREQAA